MYPHVSCCDFLLPVFVLSLPSFCVYTFVSFVLWPMYTWHHIPSTICILNVCIPKFMFMDYYCFVPSHSVAQLQEYNSILAVNLPANTFNIRGHHTNIAYHVLIMLASCLLLQRRWRRYYIQQGCQIDDRNLSQATGYICSHFCGVKTGSFLRRAAGISNVSVVNKTGFCYWKLHHLYPWV